VAASRRALSLFNPPMMNPAVTVSFALVMMVVCIATAISVHLYFERPITMALQRRLKQRMDPGMRRPLNALTAGRSVQPADVRSRA
jgi:peptidoglycan/LPS O-acetylase OafA/YrhL